MWRNKETKSTKTIRSSCFITMASKRGKEKAKHDDDGDASWNKAGNGGKKNEDAAWQKGDSRYAWPGVSPAPDSHIAWAKYKVEAAKEEESWEGRDHSDWQYDVPRPSNTHEHFGHGAGEEEERRRRRRLFTRQMCLECNSTSQSQFPASLSIRRSNELERELD